MFWKIVAKILSRPRVAVWLINRARRTPYSHLPEYMDRYWLFNPYQDASGRYVPRGWIKRRLPSVRIHHIKRKDEGDHLHDHPWNARTVILFGWYWEILRNGDCPIRRPGDTRAIDFGEYHHISRVSQGGVWTLFITWGYRGEWGFLMDDGSKMPWREYLGKYRR